MTSITQDLLRESEATRALLLNLRDVIAGDDDAVQDIIEGETNLKEAAAQAAARLAELDAFADAIKGMRDELGSRASRLTAQAESIRAALASAMATAEITKLELPQATISLKATPPKAIVFEEAVIPSKFWKRADPKLDVKALLEAMKSGEAIPGAQLSNGGQTVQLRWK